MEWRVNSYDARGGRMVSAVRRKRCRQSISVYFKDIAVVFGATVEMLLDRRRCLDVFERGKGFSASKLNNERFAWTVRRCRSSSSMAESIRMSSPRCETSLWKTIWSRLSTWIPTRTKTPRWSILPGVRFIPAFTTAMCIWLRPASRP
jgi:hypothetical protein